MWAVETISRLYIIRETNVCLDTESAGILMIKCTRRQVGPILKYLSDRTETETIKKQMMKIKILLMVTVMTIFSFVVKSNENRVNVLKNKRLVIAMDTCRYNYFIQKGYPCGYQLELFEMFAEHSEISLDFRIVPDSLKFDMLNRGDIDIMVFSEGFDSLYNVFSQYKNICSSIPLDDSIKSLWLTAESNMPLIMEINNWASKMKGEHSYNILHSKYFRHQAAKIDGGLSGYDNILKKYSAEIGLDWRLTASIAYHESKFKPRIVSRSGAAGIMQLMPNTVRRFGVRNVYDPEENIKGGIKLIAYLMDIFTKKGVPDDELMNYVLASYNAGHGKIFKLMDEASSLNLDPNKWNDVYSVIMMKNRNSKSVPLSKSKFSGKETVMFVDRVLRTYMHYRNFADEESKDKS
jgi:membrane-bound lytic murein transglycosylase MltF